MIESGYIYVLQNDAHNPYIVKIGLTRHSPDKRTKDIYWGATGVPLKFDIAAAFSVGNCVLAEKVIHQRLATFRVNPRREFFKIRPEIAAAISLETCALINAKMRIDSPEILRFEKEKAKSYLAPIPDIIGIEESKCEMVQVKLSDLKKSPVGTSKLSPTQIDRIRILHFIFQPVLDISLKEIIESFSRDLIPETEIMVWENMAKVFLSFDSLPGYNKSQKMEAFKVILARSGQPESEMDQIIKNSSLEEEAIEFLLSKYRTGKF